MLLLRTARRGRLVGVLLGEHLGEVRVVELEVVLGPLSVEAGAVAVALADGVRAGEGDDVLVGEALGVEYLAEVRAALVAVGEASDLALDRLGGRGGVLTSELGRDGGPAHGLDGDVCREGPEVGVADGSRAVLVGDRLEEVEGHGGEAGVGAEGTLAAVGEAHGGVWAA